MEVLFVAAGTFWLLSAGTNVPHGSKKPGIEGMKECRGDSGRRRDVQKQVGGGEKELSAQEKVG